ncbi:hypothetical protein Tco_1491959 [Tanacetum coccineum]
MQSQDIQINSVRAMDDSLIVSKGSLIEPENNNAFSKSEIETQMQRQEEKVDMCEAVDAGLVVTESSGTKPDKQDTSSSSGNYTTQAVDADIGPVNDEEPFAEVQLTALHNILANEQQHTEQSEPRKTQSWLPKVLNLIRQSSGIQSDEHASKCFWTKQLGSLFHLMTLDHSSSSLSPHCLMMSVHISSGLVLHLDVIRWQKRIFLHLNLQDEITDLHAHNSLQIGKGTFSKIYKNDEAQQESVSQGECDDPALELAKKMSLDAHKEKGEGEGADADADIERAIKLSLDPSFLPQGRAPIGGVTIRDPVSETTPKLPKVVGKESETKAAAPKGDKEQGEVASSTVTSGVSIPVKTQDQAESNSGKVHVSLAGPNPEHMDDEFLATAYPKVHESLKLITDERVIKDNPESHSGSMSSMKNLEDTDNFGDQFLYDKPTKDDQEKSKVIDESDSTIPDPSHQTVMSTPPVIASVIDFSSPKPSSLVTPSPINTEAITITTSLP